MREEHEARGRSEACGSRRSTRHAGGARGMQELSSRRQRVTQNLQSDSRERCLLVFSWLSPFSVSDPGLRDGCLDSGNPRL